MKKRFAGPVERPSAVAAHLANCRAIERQKMSAILQYDLIEEVLIENVDRVPSNTVQASAGSHSNCMHQAAFDAVADVGA
jgi:hypothetical protein